MNVLLEFRNVRMHYPYEQFALIDDLSFEVFAGECVGIVCAPQWGKSTIAKLIAGLKTPTAGEVFLKGKPLNDTPPSERNIAVIYDDFALMNGRRFWANAAFPLKIRNVDKNLRKEKALQALEKFGLEEFAFKRVNKKTPHKQKLSLALARASLRNFDLIVFDDVFKKIDASFALQQIKMLTDGRDAAQLYLSSDVTKLSFCNRLIVVASCKNCFCGTFKECEEYIVNSKCFDILWEVDCQQ